MTTDEIIKALRWCQDINKSCDGCPCDGKAHCHDRLMSLAADKLEKLNNIGYWLMKLMKGEHDDNG